MKQPKHPRFQVAIKDLILATTFFGVALGLWLFQREDPSLSGYRFIFVCGAMTTFGAAIGSIFGRPMRGAMIGVLLLPAAPLLFVFFGA